MKKKKSKKAIDCALATQLDPAQSNFVNGLSQTRSNMNIARYLHCIIF